MKDLIEEPEKCDLQPQAASRWTSTCAEEIMNDIDIRTTTGLHKLPFEKFKIPGCTFKQAGRTQDSQELRMQTANKAWWRDVKIDRSKDVP